MSEFARMRLTDVFCGQKPPRLLQPRASISAGPIVVAANQKETTRIRFGVDRFSCVRHQDESISLETHWGQDRMSKSFFRSLQPNWRLYSLARSAGTATPIEEPLLSASSTLTKCGFPSVAKISLMMRKHSLIVMKRSLFLYIGNFGD
jgi:hypothetical protein